VRADERAASVYDWRTSVAVAVGGTVAAVALIVAFTYLVDVIGDFWSQVVYFVAVFGAIIAGALRSRRNDSENPSRLGRMSTPITPVGLPGPFVTTQAIGVLGIAMLAVGAVIRGDRGIIWIFSGFVLVLLGGVGLAFWAAGLVATRRRRPR
jgi:hypothetical protein